MRLISGRFDPSGGPAGISWDAKWPKSSVQNNLTGFIKQPELFIKPPDLFHAGLALEFLCSEHFQVSFVGLKLRLTHF